MLDALAFFVYTGVTMNKTKFHIITYGCQMNKNDSERIAGLLQSVGMDPTDQPTEADLILLNSCSVRQTAEDRIFGQVKQLAKMRRKQRPDLIIAVTGCMAGRDKDGRLKKKLPEVDLFFPTVDAVQLPRWIAELNPDLLGSPNPPLDPPLERGEDLTEFFDVQPSHNSKFQAFVPIQTGCNNFCSYCVVPHARGLQKNRPLGQVLNEVRDLAKKGYVEITLLGQAVNTYEASDPEQYSSENPYKDHFAALLWEINQVQGVERIFFTAPYPRNMTDEVIDALALPKMVNYLHLPAQSGDNEVLKRMNRKYTREEYLELVKRIQKRVPNIALGTDIIVGFCGETEEEFQNTVDLYKQAQFDISYTAMYSTRSGTVAAKAFKDDVSREEKKRRWKILHQLMEEIVLKKNQAFVGQEVSVLVEKFENGICTGNSNEMKMVQFRGSEDLVGKVVLVKIGMAKEWVLFGEKI